ncbi:hypothetical protein [Microbacterium paraoxydans]|uniref:hypothetical protein n=1 Tax=Microbacterium paraoxydans TaxID=199592 RepID=UPI003D7400CD
MQRLAEVDKLIAAHPLAQDSVREAHALIESTGERDKDALSGELAARGLPTLEELGRIQVQTTSSWWRLRRERKKILRKIERLAR